MSDLPVSSLREAIPHLRRPYPAESIRWKVQSTLSNNRGLVVGYVDARLVTERLNAVCPDLWSDETRPIGDRIDSGLWQCTLTIAGKSRSDVGEGQGKSGYSDSIKRAGTRFGVAAHIYSIPQQILGSTENGAKKEGKPTLRRVKKGQKQILYITPECERWLAKQYEAWLKDHGIKAFGEPLSHGDIEGSVGSLLEGEAASDDEPAQGDLLLSAKRQEAESIYAEIPAAKRPKLPPARFKAKLDASTDGQLDEFIAELTELSRA